MFYLRAVSNYKHFWPGSFKREEVIGALQSWDNSPLSVYKVASSAEAERVIVLYGMAAKPHVEKLNYVLLPEKLLLSCGVKPKPEKCDYAHPLLQSTHHELLGLENPQVREAVADALQFEMVMADRISDKNVKRFARRELEHPTEGDAAMALALLREDERPRWKSFVQEYLASKGSSGNTNAGN